MKNIFAVLAFIGICLGAINSSAQSDSAAINPTNNKSTHHGKEHRGGKGHHKGFRLFHHKHHGRHGHHNQEKRHGHEERDSKNKQDQSKK
ncbi:MAG: hypothetical protein ABI663_12845 [Chryseolinea sp.]